MADYPRCKTCRWWLYLEIFNTSLIHPDWGLCQLADQPNIDKRPSPLFEVDGDDEKGIVTAPDFGCVQHEPGEPQGHIV